MGIKIDKLLINFTLRNYTRKVFYKLNASRRIIIITIVVS